MNDLRHRILAEIDALLARQIDPADLVLKSMQILAGHYSHFYWTGIYLLKGDTLHVGPYVGPPTDHVRIHVGRGVCGSAVADNTNKIVDDVRTESNYLACNLKTRSEIVVLVRDPADQTIIGQIDIDSTQVKGFGKEEELLLEDVAKRIAPAMKLLGK